MSLCMRAVKHLASLCESAGSPKLSLLAYAISLTISYTGSTLESFKIPGSMYCFVLRGSVTGIMG